MDAGDKKELFEGMPIPKAIAVMAMPTIVSQLVNLIYNIADTFFIGRSGNTNMVAAVTLVFPLFMMTSSFSSLFGIGGGSLVARLIGQGSDDQAQKVSAFSFYGALAAAFVYSAVIALFLTPILHFLGASSATVDYARQYVWAAIILGGVPTILAGTGAHLLRNVGYAKQASIGLSGGGILNMALDPLFMFVLLPKGWEVLGAALATMLSNAISFAYLLAMLIKVSGVSAVSVAPVRIKGIERRYVRETLTVGIPSAVLALLYDAANIVLNALMAAYGDLALAAIGIVMKAERLPTVINIGICQGMLPIVAYNCASGDHGRMKQAIRTARNVGLLVAGFSIVLFEVFAAPIVQFFLDTSVGSRGDSLKTIAFAVIFLRIRCLVAPSQLFNYHTSYCMQAIGDGPDTLLHAIVREIVLYIPLMLILNHVWGIYALAGTLVISESGAAVFASVLLGWKIKRLAVKSRV